MIRESRQVGFKTIFDLLKQKRIPFTLGVVFTILPLAFVTILLIVSSLLGSDVPEVDYEKIDRDGKSAKGILSSIETQENITINNEHPSIISYRFSNGDKEIESQYKSLASDKIGKMNVGDTINIKYLADSSIIIGLEPFEFPYGLFLNVLIPFAIIGLAMWTFLYFRVRDETNLYRHGEIKEAKIVSLIPKDGLPISGIGQGVTVHYQYKTTRGQSILGESFTRDYSILNSKKQGDVVKIFVSVDNESKSCLISKLDQIRNNWRID